MLAIPLIDNAIPANVARFVTLPTIGLMQMPDVITSITNRAYAQVKI